MLFHGVFRVFMGVLFGVFTVTSSPQYTSAATVLKNPCLPNDYLCNHIYQLKLETHGLISALERRYPDLVNGEQYHNDKRSDTRLSGIEDGSIQKLEEVSMKPSEFSEGTSKEPSDNSQNEKKPIRTTADPRDGSSFTSQTPSTSVRRSDTIPTDQQTASSTFSGKAEQKVKTSPTQSDHRSDSTTALSAGDPVTNSLQHEPPDGVSTFAALFDHSTRRPVPKSSPDTNDAVSQVILDHETSTQPTTSVTNETLSRGTPSVSPIKEAEKTSHVSKFSTSKPVPNTIGHVNSNEGSQVISDGIGTTEHPSDSTTYAKHRSSTRGSPMIAKSTTETAALDEDVFKISDSEFTTVGPKTTFEIREETTSLKSTLKAKVGATAHPSDSTTDAKHRSSTRGSPMIAKSTTETAALDEDVFKISDSEFTTVGPKTTFEIGEETTSLKSTLKAKVGATAHPSDSMTDAKHRSSTRGSPMIAKSTTETAALDEDIFKISDSEFTTVGPKTTFGIKEETTSLKSTLKAEVGETSSLSEEHTLTPISSTTGETKEIADSDHTTREQTSLSHVSASSQSPILVTNKNQFTSAKIQGGTLPLNFSTITKREKDKEESGSATTKPLRVMETSSKEPIPSTDSNETVHQTTLSPVSLTTVSADASSTTASQVAEANTTPKVTSRASTEAEYISGSGDTFLVSPTDVAESSTAGVPSTSTQARVTTSAEQYTNGPVSERANNNTEFDGNRTVIEGKWTAHYNTETLKTDISYTEIVTEEIGLTTLPEITSGVNIRDATTRRALEASRRTETTQSSPSPQSSQTTELTVQPEGISTSSLKMSTLEKDVTVVEDESDVIFVTSIDDITDTHVTTEKDVTASKFLTTETIEETDIIEETFVTVEIDVTTNVYDETTNFLLNQDITTRRDATTEKSMLTSKDIPSTKHHTIEQEVTTSKYDTTEKYITTENATTTIKSTTETVRTTPITTTAIPKTTEEPTTPTPAPPRDCDEVWRRGSRESGIYTIFPNTSPGGFEVFCDLHDVDGGWTVIQRRVNGSVNFYMPWFDYLLGFGTLQREFYLGNEKIHQLTNQKKYELSILLWDFEDESRYARYQVFRLGDYMSGYELSVRGYTGNAGNSLGYHSRGRFSAFDRDFDDNPAENCARMYGSGWWFKDCNAKSNLNGQYLRGENTQRGRGITWKKWKGLEYSLKYSEMRIKPNGL